MPELNLKVGDTVRLRNGKTLTITRVTPENLYVFHSDGLADCWTKTGDYFARSKGPHSRDIVEVIYPALTTKGGHPARIVADNIFGRPDDLLVVADCPDGQRYYSVDRVTMKARAPAHSDFDVIRDPVTVTITIPASKLKEIEQWIST